MLWMTRRAYGSGSLHQRTTGTHAGRWEYRLVVDGRRRTATFHAKPTREQLKAKDRAWSSPSALPLPPAESVGEYLERWLRDGCGELRPRTRDGYRTLFRLHVAPRIGDVGLRDLSAPDVQRLVNGLSADRLRPRTVLHVLASLRAALSQAVRWELLDRNVAALVRSPKIPQTEVHPLTPEQTRKLLASVKGDSLEALWNLAAMTGMRLGEVLGLRWQDVDLSAGRLTVSRSLWWRPAKGSETQRQPKLTEPKTPRSRRTIELGPRLVSMLREHHKAQLDSEREVDDALVFTRPNGMAWEPTLILRRLRWALAAAGLPAVRFHDLRHGYISDRLAEGWPVALVAEAAGHSTPTTTLNTYAHTIEKAQRSMALAAEKSMEETA